MTQKERLIELLKQGQRIDHDKYTESYNQLLLGNISQIKWTPEDCLELIANHLIMNGVFVPPCKIGEVLYIIHRGDVYSYTVKRFYQECPSGEWYIVSTDGYLPDISVNAFGKTVFYSKESAILALQEASSNENLY